MNPTDTLSYGRWKNSKSPTSKQKYTELNNSIKHQCRQTKENWVTVECQEAEHRHAQYDPINFHNNVNKLLSQKTLISSLIHYGLISDLS